MRQPRSSSASRSRSAVSASRRLRPASIEAFVPQLQQPVSAVEACIPRQHVRDGRSHPADRVSGDDEGLEGPRPLRLRARLQALGQGEQPLRTEHQVSGRMCGNRITSRMLGESVSSITRRSMPMPQPAVGGMPYSSARMIVGVVVHRLLVAGVLGLRLRVEARRLVLGVVELGEAVGELAAGDEELEALGDRRVGVGGARERRDLGRIVDDEGRLRELRLGDFLEQRELQRAQARFLRVPAAFGAQLAMQERAVRQLRVGIGAGRAHGSPARSSCARTAAPGRSLWPW